MIRRSVLAAVLFAVPVAALAGPEPGFEEPGMHSAIAASPNEIRLEFKEKVDPAGTGMTVTNSKGKSVGLDQSHVSPTDATLLTVGVDRLPPDTYTVDWHAKGLKSQETSKGSYTFKVN